MFPVLFYYFALYKWFLYMIKIEVSKEIRALCPDFRGGSISASVRNSDFNPELWGEINNCITAYRNTHHIEDIKKHPVISATRAAYKTLGKDPNRYRPSSEALYRRILRDLPLYKLNTLVDIINFVSIKFGYSIGGFDTEKISGDLLTLGVGEAEEPYEAIGRGIMNIDGLPVYRDAIGGIGTPTSDNERTKIGLETNHILLILNGYNGETGLNEAINFMQSLLTKYVQASDIEIDYF